jgi:hypothetical protein
MQRAGGAPRPQTSSALKGVPAEAATTSRHAAAEVLSTRRKTSTAHSARIAAVTGGRVTPHVPSKAATAKTVATTEAVPTAEAAAMSTAKSASAVSPSATTVTATTTAPAVCHDHLVAGKSGQQNCRECGSQNTQVRLHESPLLSQSGQRPVPRHYTEMKAVSGLAFGFVMYGLECLLC